MKAARVLASMGSAFLVAATCPPEGFESVENFDLKAFAAKRWYIQQQAPTVYLPENQNYCVYAEYKLLEKPTVLGYDVDVHNHAQEKDGKVHDSGSLIKAKIVDAKRGQLLVGTFFLPTFLAGPYWVIDYSEEEGYALISGGPPKVEGKDGKCKNGGGVNGSGLWIFTRSQSRDDTLMNKVRSIAEAKGFDLSVLNDVDQSNCKSQVAEASEAAITV
eukprot:TRINITY_DN174_c0_g1_i1.p1 TRINITY_DN174_c0_g1~~TRINITY_DN174_c0_g1_i1.p1  ORF type:complete len:217 (-),score=40.07 TRINITY_DN174_c0_g1_i1:203-853(-)